MTRGAIQCEQAYAQGKMLDSSSWNGFLPRDITPSDIDHVFDNNGRMIFCEFSSTIDEWAKVPTGQRIVYERLVRDGRGKHVAVLARHEVPKTQQIDTRADVVAFSVMWWNDKSSQTLTRGPINGKYWELFVWRWFQNAANVVCSLTEKMNIEPSHISKTY